MHQEKILGTEELSEIISLMKRTKPTGILEQFIAGIPLFSQFINHVDWKKMIAESNAELIDEVYANELLSTYDIESMRFQGIIHKNTERVEL